MWKRRLIPLAAALVALALLGGAEGIDENELQCEEAVRHLIDCCPDDAPIKQVSCYAGRDCDDSQPQLSPGRAQCLRDASCDDLYASGACAAPKTAPGCAP